jgi:hypothetical protein
MRIMINDSSRYAASAAGRALSLAVRAEALADEINALHGDIIFVYRAHGVGQDAVGAATGRASGWYGRTSAPWKRHERDGSWWTWVS